MVTERHCPKVIVRLDRCTVPHAISPQCAVTAGERGPGTGIILVGLAGDNHMVFTTISTERLALRELAASDAQRIFEYRFHPEISRFQPWGTRGKDEIESHIRRQSTIEPGTPAAWYQVGIALRSSGELVGDCGFQVLEAEPRQAELGIALAPEYQAQGYATEGLRAFLGYLLVTLGKHRVFGSVDPRNLRSVRLMERVGMRKEAHLVQRLLFKGEWVDDVLFALLASEWRR